MSGEARYALSRLLATYSAAPYTESTREMCPGLLAQCDDMLEAAGVDLNLLGEQLKILWNGFPIPRAELQTRQEWIDLRVTAQHLLVLTARLLPMTSSALADTYFGKLGSIDLEEGIHGEALLRELPVRAAGSIEAAATLRRAGSDWSRLLALTSQEAISTLGEWLILTRSVLLLNEIHACCAGILDAMTRAEFAPLVEQPT